MNEVYDPAWICHRWPDGEIEHLWPIDSKIGDRCWCKRKTYPYKKQPLVKWSVVKIKFIRRKNGTAWHHGFFDEIDFNSMTPLEEVIWFLRK